MRNLTILLLASYFSTPGSNLAHAKDNAIETLKSLSLDQLAQLEVSIASNIPHSLAKSAAAVYVLTQEDIRRSSATSIPEVLRLVPGIHVARINANNWAITVRGFNDIFSNKLLVLMDGRTVYTPLFSGVYWDVQDTLLEDIERIEVIRGPGAAVWGANAVNGVINIITKSAQDSQGGLFTAGVGNEERWYLGGRFGGTLGQNGAYRIYAKGFQRDGASNADGSDAEDDWDVRRLGFRTDFKLEQREQFTIQGDMYEGDAIQYLDINDSPVNIKNSQKLSGGNLQSHWFHETDTMGLFQLQVYYDRAHRGDLRFDQTVETTDVSFQHNLSLGSRQQLAWGLGYRHIEDDLPGGSLGTVSTDPTSTNYDIMNVFIEDEIEVVAELLRFSIGAKLEHNDFTGSDLQPNLRLLWTPDERQVVWTAWSRAVRTPSRLEADLSVILPDVVVSGNPNQKAETVNTYEAGYRLQLGEHIGMDATIFHNEYNNLVTVDTLGVASSLPPPPIVTTPLQLAVGNGAEAQGQGLELAVDWEAKTNWQLRLAYTFLHIDVESVEPGSEPAFDLDAYPYHQVVLRSLLDIGSAWELDAYLYYVDKLNNSVVDSYTRIDLRLGWLGPDGLEASLALQNLLDERHLEFVPSESTSGGGLYPSEIQRSIFFNIKKHF